MRARQRLDAAFDRLHVVVDALGAGEPDDRLDHGERVAGAMIDLARQQDLPLVGLLAVGDVDGDAGDAHHLAGAVDARGRGADAPADFAVRAQHAELGLPGARALRHAARDVLQRTPIVGMDEARECCPR